MKKSSILILILLTLTFTYVDISYSSETSATKEALKDFFPVFFQKNRFVEGTEDLPLYKGLIINKDKFIIYEDVTGSILHVEYTGKFIDAQKVEKFYKRSLPEFGWNNIKIMEYERDGELLNIEIHKESFFQIVLKIDLKTKPSK